MEFTTKIKIPQRGTSAREEHAPLIIKILHVRNIIIFYHIQYRVHYVHPLVCTDDENRYSFGFATSSRERSGSV